MNAHSQRRVHAPGLIGRRSRNQARRLPPRDVVAGDIREPVELATVVPPHGIIEPEGSLNENALVRSGARRGAAFGVARSR